MAAVFGIVGKSGRGIRLGHGCNIIGHLFLDRMRRASAETGLTYALIETRSPTQKPAHKDLERNGQSPAITFKAAYAPVSNRVGSRS